MNSFTIVYGSKLGSSKRVAKYIAEKTGSLPPISAASFNNINALIDSNSVNALLLIASTWGDGELQDDMESLLVRSIRLETPVGAHLVELGNYYGYDDFEFGALAIMESLAQNLELTVWQRLSLDSFPKIDWSTLDRWLSGIRR